jgi:putative peptidoglycan lipid II flippase
LFFTFKEMGRPPHVGIALATSIAGWVNALLLWATLRHRGDFVGDRRLLRNLPIITAASLAMGAAVWFAIPQLAPYFSAEAILPVQALALAAIVMLGLFVFFGLTLATGVLDLRRVAGMARGRTV